MQRQLQTLIDRQDAYNMQILQDLAAREVQFIWHVLPNASTLDIKKHTQRRLNGQTPESFEGGIIFMSMFKDIEWTKKALLKPVCTMPKKWQQLRSLIQAWTLVLPGAGVRKYKGVAAYGAQFKPGHWFFVDLESEKTWWNGNPNKPQKQRDIVALQMVDMCKCHTSQPIFPATEPSPFWTVEERWKKLPFPRCIRQQKDSHDEPYWQAIYFVFTVEVASGMRMKIRYLHREEWKKKSKSPSS